MRAPRPNPTRHRRPEEEPADLAPISDPDLTVVTQIRRRIAASPERIAFRHRAAADPDPHAAAPPADPADPATWVEHTWADFGAAAEAVAAGLIDLGVAPGDRVGILSGTRYEWVLADTGAMFTGAATTPLYPTAIDAELVHILRDAGVGVLFAEDADHVRTLAAHADQLPGLREIIVLDDRPGEAAAAAPGRVRTFAELLAAGRAALAADPGRVAARAEAVTADDLCTLMYTSGTTGLPKGVRLSHRAVAYQGAVSTTIGFIHEGDSHYLWLPLTHSFGKVLLGASYQVGAVTTIDGDVNHLAENLAAVRPAFLACVPRVLEKIHAGVGSAMDAAGGAKAALYRWAVAVGGRAWALRCAGEPVPARLRAQVALADRLVFAKIRARFGGNVQAIMSGAAPLAAEVADWFAIIGLPVYEGYGMTEYAAAATVNRMWAWRAGTVGWALPGTELAIAPDGEVLLRGPGVMDGYHGLPEATAEVIDADGWLHTGDIGRLDDREFLRITDRKKELFKTSTGKYVAPTKIESTFGALCPFTAQIVVDGPGRKFVSALVALDEAAIRDWAARHGLGSLELPHLAKAPEVRELIGGYVEQLNATLSHWERVRRFTILDRELSVEAGELTPTMKLRRRTIMANFRHLLDSHYAPH
ncbi:AMP-dependent synthetase/ligase [Corynebacterium sphenisci]|uniref:AMP-dependent synthetase/ligase n=1 Tax=Corynebacterium sphenisci TaxID=191493 RepID=UPI000952D941|nr:long-chain fatty acid--CoA ligase [Corynebacterium sphenisci]